MKKLIYLLILVMVGCLLVLPGVATSEGPEITLHPQSPNYPQYSTAMYIVKAKGTNLEATWYMEWQGKTYNISDTSGSMQAWEPFAGETYGAVVPEENVFVYFFGGIEIDLDGAYIWCEIEDGVNKVISQSNRISVGNENMPPEILEFPSYILVEQGEEVVIRCVARSTDESQLSFLWYQTDTAMREDMYAVNRGTETSDYMICDTSEVGTRFYICMVESSNGGITYSSVVSVNVVEKKAEETEPQLPPETQPETQPETVPETTPETSPAVTDPKPTDPMPTDPKPSDPEPTPDTTPETRPVEKPQDTPKDEGLPLWAMILIAAAAAGAGFGIVLLIGKKKA